MTFAIGTMVGVVWARIKGQSLAVLAEVPLASWCLGVYGLLGFHACYFFALQSAPPLEASLIVFLWPLLLVLMSGLFPRGTAVPACGGGMSQAHCWDCRDSAHADEQGREHGAQRLGFGLRGGRGSGAHLVQLFGASRFFASVPSTAVMGSCALTMLGPSRSISHWRRRSGRTRSHPGLRLSLLGWARSAMAFYLWDEGMKHGDIRLLGVAAYTTPLFSTVILAVAGLGTATPTVWLAAF